MSVDINPEVIANTIKEEGNNFFKQGEYSKACNKYTEAINICPTAILYGMKLRFTMTAKQIAHALRDADKAVELDPSYAKGFYRRGSAHFYSGNLQASLDDFKQCLAVNPVNPGVRKKIEEIRKLIKLERFSSAIHVENVSFADQVVLKDLRFSTEIEGPTIDFVNDGSDIDDYTITERFILDMQKWHKEGKKIHPKFVYIILVKTIRYLRTLPNIIELSLPEGDQNTFRVCGDVHGQYYDFMNIFSLFGYPSKETPYLFNGDFTDRGNFSVEVALTAFCYKLVKPDCFFVLRGNHESPVNKMFGFDGEVRAKYDGSIMQLFTECFQALPIAALLEKRVLILHGGLFKKDGVLLRDIQKINRFTDCMSGLLEDLLWSDPMDGKGRQPSRREAGTMFGEDVTKQFLDDNHLDLLVRSHEVKMTGYDVQHDISLGCITIFSAPNYCDTTGNKGAILKFDHSLKPHFETFDAVPHPGPGAMYYAPKMY
ncbi:hypothetical protein WA538_006011 [Blastocystis sp. DL]